MALINNTFVKGSLDSLVQGLGPKTRMGIAWTLASSVFVAACYKPLKCCFNYRAKKLDREAEEKKRIYEAKERKEAKEAEEKAKEAAEERRHQAQMEEIRLKAEKEKELEEIRHQHKLEILKAKQQKVNDTNPSSESSYTASLDDEEIIIIEQLIKLGKEGPSKEPVSGASIKDKPRQSSLLGQSGEIILLSGVEGSGKSTLAISITAEACGGKSLNIMPGTNGITGPSFKVYYIYAEEDSQFETHYNALIKPITDKFKVWHGYTPVTDWQSCLIFFYDKLNETDGHCVFCLDNTTACFGRVNENGASDFIAGLRGIRRHARMDNKEVTFIIVNHYSKTTNGVCGTQRWGQLCETHIKIEEADKNKDIIDGQIIEFKKHRAGPPYKYRVKRIIEPYMHFEIVEVLGPEEYEQTSKQEKPTVDEAISVDSPKKNNGHTLDSRKEVTDEVVDLFIKELKAGLSYTQVYEKYKEEYKIKSRDTVYNKTKAKFKKNKASNSKSQQK